MPGQRLLFLLNRLNLPGNLVQLPPDFRQNLVEGLSGEFTGQPDATDVFLAQEFADGLGVFFGENQHRGQNIPFDLAGNCFALPICNFFELLGDRV